MGILNIDLSPVNWFKAPIKSTSLNLPNLVRISISKDDLFLAINGFWHLENRLGEKQVEMLKYVITGSFISPFKIFFSQPFFCCKIGGRPMQCRCMQLLLAKKVYELDLHFNSTNTKYLCGRQCSIILQLGVKCQFKWIWSKVHLHYYSRYCRFVVLKFFVPCLWNSKKGWSPPIRGSFPAPASLSPMRIISGLAPRAGSSWKHWTSVIQGNQIKRVEVLWKFDWQCEQILQQARDPSLVKFEFRLNLGEYYFDHKTFSKGILCVQSNFLVIVEAVVLAMSVSVMKDSRVSWGWVVLGCCWGCQVVSIYIWVAGVL